MDKRKSVIFIHGIGEQQPGYSDALFDILTSGKENLKNEIHKYEMLYDYVNETINVKLEIEKLVQQCGKDQTIANIVTDTITHVLYFYAMKDARNWILKLFEQKLLQVVMDGREEGVPPVDHGISIISHSLGTFVAYEGLHYVIGRKSVGIQDEVYIKNFFTLASPIALIKKTNDRLQKVTGELAIVGDIKKPIELNQATNTQVSNVWRWCSFRHISDLVASLEVLQGDFLDRPPLEFNKSHEGSNVHAFKNYMIEFKDFMLEKILGD